MSDDLVKRLRYTAVHSYLGRSVTEEAAVRIEQLERELSISRMAQVVMDNTVETLTAERDAARIVILEQTSATREAALRQAADAVEDYCSDMPDLAGHGHSVGLKDAIFDLIEKPVVTK